MRILTSTEVAKILDVDVRTVQRRAQDGLIPTHKLPGVNGAYIFDADEIATLNAAIAEVDA